MRNLNQELEELKEKGFYLENGSCCGNGEVEYDVMDVDDVHVGSATLSNGTRYGEEVGDVHSLNV